MQTPPPDAHRRFYALGDLRLEGGALVRNLEFLRFAHHWGFTSRVSPLPSATKGTVERPVRYLRSRFLYGRAFLGDADLQAQGDTWLTDVANARVHATTGAVPAVRFVTEELAALGPLAPRPYHPLVPATAAPRRLDRHPLVPVPVERRALTTYTEPLTAVLG